MHILVTGASGFVGTALIPRLRRAGHTVVGIDRRPLQQIEIEQFVEADLRNDEAREEAFREPVDLVIHLAAAKDDFGITDEEFYEENRDVTRALLDSGVRHGVRDWIFYSSVAVLGLAGADNRAPSAEDAAPRPYNAYGGSKQEAEALFLDLARTDSEVRVVTIRPAIIYGPGNFPYTNMYRLIDGLHRNRFMLVGPGETIKSSCYIDNMVDATLFLMDYLRPGVQTFVYVDEPALTSAEIVERVSKALGRRPPSWHIPVGFARTVAYLFDFAAKLTGINFPITAARIRQFRTPTHFEARAIRDLGFRQAVPTDVALERTVEWYLKQVTKDE